MSISRVKTWNPGDVLTAADLNSEFNNIIQNGTTLAFPLTSNVTGGGFILSNVVLAANSAKIGSVGLSIGTLRWNAAAAVTDGATIAHGMGTTPTAAFVQSTVASQFASVTTLDATNITVAIKSDTGGAGSSQTIYWMALV